MVKGAIGTQIKVFFQGLHMTCVIFGLFYNLKLCILNLTLHVRYNILSTN